MRAPSLGRAAAASPSDTLSGSPYGADGSGLVCGYRFLPGAGAVPLDSMTAAEMLDRRAAAGPGTQEDGGFLWLHFSLAHAAAERWLARHAGLPGSFFEMLREGQAKWMEQVTKGAPLPKIPAFEALRAQQEAFFKAMTAGFAARDEDRKK